MNKIWRVAVTEYLNAVRSKAFIVGVLALPLLIFVSVVLQQLGARNRDVRDRRFRRGGPDRCIVSRHRREGGGAESAARHQFGTDGLGLGRSFFQSGPMPRLKVTRELNCPFPNACAGRI